MFGGGGRLGVSLEEVGADDVGRLGLPAERGAVVTDVQDGSAAEKAGLKADDVIVRFGGQDVWSAAQLARLVRETPAGRTVELDVSRAGSIQKLSVALTKPDRDVLIGRGPMGEDFHFEMPDLPELADLPAPPVPPTPPSFEGGPMRHLFRLGQGRKLGIAYQELGDQLARYFKVEGGVLVTDVDEDGPAVKAGLKAGDVIVRMGGKAVKDGGDLREALAEGAAGSSATIGVQRDGRPMDLTVKLGEAEPARVAPAVRARRPGARK
jgi:serine protease Do